MIDRIRDLELAFERQQTRPGVDKYLVLGARSLWRLEDSVWRLDPSGLWPPDGQRQRQYHGMPILIDPDNAEAVRIIPRIPEREIGG